MGSIGVGSRLWGGVIGRIALVTGLFAAAGELSAHPGHGSDEGWSLLHWLGEPEHIIPLAGALLLGGLLSVRRIRRRSSQ